MSNKKKIIGLLIIVFVLCFIATIIIFSFSGKKYKKTIFIGNTYKYTIDGNKISLSNEDEKARKQKVNIYYDKKIIDGYVLTESEESSFYNNNIHIYSSSSKPLYNDQYSFGFTKDLTLNIIGFNTEEAYDLVEMIAPILKSGIDIKTVNPDYFTINSFDIDDDEKIEYVYSMGLTYEKDKYYSSVIMEKGGKYYSIIEENGDAEDEEKSILSLFGIIDFNSDGNYEYVISRSNGEYAPNSYELYNFNGSSFEKLNLE